MTQTAARIIVGVDGSKASVQALRFAHRQAALTGAQLHAVTTWRYPFTGDVPVGDTPDWQRDAEAILDTALSAAIPAADLGAVTRHVSEGHPAAVLLEQAQDAEMLVVGSRGHGGFAGMLLGSVSQHVVAHSPCPVVVVR